ncbi:MAG: cytochrome C oxidase subunit IV family protein [Proteobacteria bacterium]|nr:cytochrome C oxidase subunit IV family protein [Pseudomonadota bacterium]
MTKPMRPCTLIWLSLMLLTVATYAIGEAGMGGTAVMLTVLGIAVIKVQMVASYFMDLRHTRWLWRGIVLGWLVLVTGLIAIAYLTTIK